MRPATSPTNLVVVMGPRGLDEDAEAPQSLQLKLQEQKTMKITESTLERKPHMNLDALRARHDEVPMKQDPEATNYGEKEVGEVERNCQTE